MRHLSLACALTASVFASVSAQAATYNIDPTSARPPTVAGLTKKKALCNLTALQKPAK
jgi:polyisoprenoid-binding protein YceI